MNQPVDAADPGNYGGAAFVSDARLLLACCSCFLEMSGLALHQGGVLVFVLFRGFAEDPSNS